MFDQLRSFITTNSDGKTDTKINLTILTNGGHS